jgi:hypothetical protein
MIGQELDVEAFSDWRISPKFDLCDYADRFRVLNEDVD